MLIFLPDGPVQWFRLALGNSDSQMSFLSFHWLLEYSNVARPRDAAHDIGV